MSAGSAVNTARWALEIREGWVALLQSGNKTVEVRAYSLPPEIIGQPVAVCVPVEPHRHQTPSNQSSAQVPVSGLPDEMEAGFEGAREVGCLVFGGVKQYQTHEAFAADTHLHQVAAGSPFGWNPGCTECLYGWEIVQSSWHPPCPVTMRLKRLHRSIFRSV